MAAAPKDFGAKGTSEAAELFAAHRDHEREHVERMRLRLVG
jgi:hypothetical protein